MGEKGTSRSVMYGGLPSIMGLFWREMLLCKMLPYRKLLRREVCRWLRRIFRIFGDKYSAKLLASWFESTYNGKFWSLLLYSNWLSTCNMSHTLVADSSLSPKYLDLGSSLSLLRVLCCCLNSCWSVASLDGMHHLHSNLRQMHWHVICESWGRSLNDLDFWLWCIFI